MSITVPLLLLPALMTSKEKGIFLNVLKQSLDLTNTYLFFVFMP